MLEKDKLYPVADRPPGVSNADWHLIRAKWTGEKARAIKAGEYYLSGAVIAAYREAHDLAGPYCPAKIVRIVRTRVVHETEDL